MKQTVKKRKTMISTITVKPNDTNEIEKDLFLGEFKITAYTAGPESTGKSPGHPQYGMTATGTYVKASHTIAADWNVLPPGTKVRIEGFDTVFVVEDRGGAVKGKHIDMYIESLPEARKWGVRNRKVWLID